MEPSLVLDPAVAPLPDAAAEPSGFVVLVEPAERIHFLDWGGPGNDRPDGASPGEASADEASPGVLLVHGISQTAWTWAPVARRLLRERRTVTMDLRGHGLSDAPTSGYDAATLAEDAVAVADGSGLLGDGPIVVAGHGFGAIVAAWTALRLADRCAGLVLVDGGWEDLAAATDLDAPEFLRTLDEPPEVLRSTAAFLADRQGFDPGTWDADQERAARATVVETVAGRVVPVTRPHVVEAIVETLFAYRPLDVLPRIGAPIVALMAAEDEARILRPALEAARGAVEAAGGRLRVAMFPGSGHNLMRYRPAEVAAAILGVSPGRFG